MNFFIFIFPKEKILYRTVVGCYFSYYAMMLLYYYFVHTFLYLSKHSSGNHQSFFSIWELLTESQQSQSQQKLTKNITHFTIQFRSKNLSHFMNLNFLDVENNIPLQCIQKPFWLYKFSSKKVSVRFQKKIFALHYFLTPKNGILEAPWKQTSVYFYISP